MRREARYKSTRPSMREQTASPPSDDSLEITNPVARRFIADGSNGIFLATFVDKESSLASASEYHKISKQRMSYWINKMLDLRLIKVARTERATNGSKQAVYTSVAPRFHIKQSNLTTGEWREAIALLTRHVWDRVLDSVMQASREARSDVLRVFRDKRTDTCWRLISKDGESGARDGYLLTWGRVRLTEEDYRVFQSELDAVVKRYQAKTGAQGKMVWFVAAANEEAPPTKR
jgi:DNA-binding transcriptional regulator GbsR (MarR family)